MSFGLYDKALADKISKWVNSDKVMILSPEEVKKVFEWKADTNNDKPITLPLVAIRRGKEITIESVNKRPTTFDGLTLEAQPQGKVVSLQRVPISIPYQIDIYTRYLSEADEYVRNFVFNIINYPNVVVDIPYNDTHYTHKSNIILSNTISDNSGIPERLVVGQFTRMTLGITIDDANLWSVPIRDTLSISAEVEIKEELGENPNNA